jgi:cell division protease FtsH
MTADAWLPIGFELPSGKKTRIVLSAGREWQITGLQDGGRALLVTEELLLKWVAAGLVPFEVFEAFSFGDLVLHSLVCRAEQTLSPVDEAEGPSNKIDALAFSHALSATRQIDPECALQDAVYVERISRLLPTYSISARLDDEVVLGRWLTGGAPIPATSFRRLQQTVSWLRGNQLKEVVEAAGFSVSDVASVDVGASSQASFTGKPSVQSNGPQAPAGKAGSALVFELAGRPELTAFFNEHIIDIIRHRDRYRALGIEHPSSIILHGPPGCGKTFAVEQLVEFLGWPSFQVEASSVASPYIHETSRKVAKIFEDAMNNAPSVLVIDEMEAFLADRDMGSGHHRVEEVAEFLRRIPEAVEKGVLIIGMTNRIDLIDPAIQRRGRFDHIIKVDFANEEETRALLDKLILELPAASDVETGSLARELAGRPLSDVAFVVREAARLAARSGKQRLDMDSLGAALRAAPEREREGGAGVRMGFT